MYNIMEEHRRAQRRTMMVMAAGLTALAASLAVTDGLLDDSDEDSSESDSSDVESEAPIPASSAATSNKRRRPENGDKENQPLSGNVEINGSKKRRIEHDEASEVDQEDPYTTLPPQTNEYIQLRFQLARFKGVFRTVQLPLTFTFANLHKFIMFAFGWSDGHAHQAEVFSNVVMYAKSNRPKAGMMKSYGRKPPLEPGMPEGWHAFTNADEPLFTVQERSRQRNTDWEPGFSIMKEDRGLTLGEVWTQDEDFNASEGQCANREIGIKYEYDLGSSWEIHITCESDDPFCTLNRPYNLPIIIKALGAPPIEDVCGEVYGELDGDRKRVGALLSTSDAFARFCKGEIGTEARKEELAVFVWEEERERKRQNALLLQEKQAQRQRELDEQGARGEETDDDEDSED